MVIADYAFVNAPGLRSMASARREYDRMDEAQRRRGHPFRFQSACEGKRWGHMLGPGDEPVRVLGADSAVETPIWTNREVLAVHAERAYPATPVGSWGAGPAVMGAAWDVGVEFTLGGLRAMHGAFHAVPSTRRAGNTEEARVGRRKRQQLLRSEFHNLVVMSRPFERVTWAGDSNLRPGDSLFDTLWEAGFEVIHPGTTHATSGAIDVLIVRGHKRIVSKGVAPTYLDNDPGKGGVQRDHRYGFVVVEW